VTRARARMLALLFSAAALLTACELQEVDVALPQDVVVAEVVLRAGATTQLAWLHRTRGSALDSTTVPGAQVEVRADDGSVLPFFAVPDTACFIPRNDVPSGSHGSCYSSRVNAMPIVPGRTYRLSIILPDGRSLNGVTTVPGDFRLIRPTATICSVPEFTPLEVRWTASANAWVYANESSMRGIRAALQPFNLRVNDDPLRLLGLSISRSDTTIVFPGQFGLFDRFDDDLTAALAFLQKGLPRGVITDIGIAAADRNYVNWERGGNFNPSGIVRVPSIQGDGTGVFAALVPKTFQVRVAEANRPPC
jgi:hypothetical protein